MSHRADFPPLPSPPALVIGGGMISREVILPTLFQLQRQGVVDEVTVCTRRAETVARLRQEFPRRRFIAYPDAAAGDPEADPHGWRRFLAGAQPGTAVLVATPDHFHTEIVLAAIAQGLDVVVQKPLCLKVADAHAIADAARKKGIYVLTDYHKRHDPAIRAARYRFGCGDLGQMLHGHAWIEEKREMPLENFKLWAEKSSPFEYIGVHYVDAYYYITGLKPRRVVAFGQKKFLPAHGQDAFDAVQAAIEWEDGSAFWVQTAWVLPQSNSALTSQGLHLLGTAGEYWADHKDRNCRFVTERGGYEDYNPNFFKPFDSWEPGAEVDYSGYGYRSIAQGIEDIRYIRAETAGLPSAAALARRLQILEALGPKRALPEQALIGTAVNEAVRLSIACGSQFVVFDQAMYPRLEQVPDSQFKVPGQGG